MYFHQLFHNYQYKNCIRALNSLHRILLYKIEQNENLLNSLLSKHLHWDIPKNLNYFHQISNNLQVETDHVHRNCNLILHCLNKLYNAIIGLMYKNQRNKFHISSIIKNKCSHHQVSIYQILLLNSQSNYDN